MSKLRLAIEQRGEALFLLSHGYSVGKTVATLREIRHPKNSLGEVRRAYFSGPFATTRLEGKPFEEIASKYRDLVERRARYAKALKDKWKDPLLFEQIAQHPILKPLIEE